MIILIFSQECIIITWVISMEFTIYKVNELPEFEKKLSSLCEDITFMEFNPSIKKYLFSEKCDSNIYYCVGLMCENFLELSLVFTLTEIADLLEKGIILVLKDNPEVSQMKIVENNGKNILYVSDISEMEVNTMRAIASTQIRKKHGRANAMIDEEFVDDYWKWQLGDYSVNEILSSKDRSYCFTTKQQFYSVAQKYEKTNSYYYHQIFYSKRLIKSKKKGKLDLKSIIDFINKNEDVGLNSETSLHLMKILRINEIDFWRSIKRLYLSRYFSDLKDSVFKRSIITAMKILDEIDSEYFLVPNSICVDYTKPLNEIIISLSKLKEETEKNMLTEPF